LRMRGLPADRSCLTACFEPWVWLITPMKLLISGLPLVVLVAVAVYVGC